MIISNCKECSKTLKYNCRAAQIKKGKTGLCHDCYLKSIKKENHPTWKGGFYFRNGYKFILNREHPFSNATGYVREHRLIMEEVLGRFLEPEEVVHHINHIRDDNRPENLQLTTQSIHAKELHSRVKGTCTICDLPQLARGFCKSHYWTEFLQKRRNSEGRNNVLAERAKERRLAKKNKLT